MEELADSIAPYSNEQITKALKWLETNDEFIKGVLYFYPDWSPDIVIEKLRSCHSCSDFQVTFIEMIIKNSISQTMDSFEILGLDKIKKPNVLYISNHRDIFLDSALLQNHLWDIDRPFTEISLGDNLMVHPTMLAVAKLNSMYTIRRSVSRSEMLQNSLDLSAYLRESITIKKVSSWIAQGNGRTKDGNDVTATGLIKMLMLSGGKDMKKNISDLNIVVSTISFEYEPLAFEKATELDSIERTGAYVKKEHEDLRSVVQGIKEYKGNVLLRFESLDVDRITFTNNRNKDVASVATEIDRITYKNYKLWKTNFMGYDLKTNSTKYQSEYGDTDLETFKIYLSKAKTEGVYQRLLDIYSNPVVNFEKQL